jgi:neutral ceramidase
MNRSRRQTFARLWAGVLLLFCLPGNAQQGSFRAGAATSNITPPLGLSINGNMRDHKAINVHDELHARALVLDNGEVRLAFVVVDSCMVPREIFDAAKRLAAEHTGIAADHMMMSATHTHSAPAATGIFQSEPDPEYQKFLTVRIADAVRRAARNLRPAQIGWGATNVPDQVFNRRWRMKPEVVLRDPFGGTNDQVKMNPPVGSPDLVEPAGPVDPQVCFISVQSTNGRPLALLANYSLHYVGGVESGVISADYFGAFARAVGQLLDAEDRDPPFVALLSNGTSGDINNINCRLAHPKAKPYERMNIVADAVANAVAGAVAGTKHRASGPLKAAQTELSLAVRPPTAEDVQRAEEIIARAKGPEMISLEEIYARETVLLAAYPPRVSLILQAARVGGVCIGAIPCEVFVEIGLDLKRKTPIPTFIISLANGYNGYLPTAEHHRLGGYETWRARSSYLEIDAASKVTSNLRGLLLEVCSD